MKITIFALIVSVLVVMMATPVMADPVGLPEHPTATSIRLSTELAERKGCDVAAVQDASREWKIEYWRTAGHKLPVTLLLDYRDAEFGIVEGEEQQRTPAYEFIVDGEQVPPTRGGIVALRLTKGDVTADLIFNPVIDHVKYAVNVYSCNP